jgi:hypothetical protein
MERCVGGPQFKFDRRKVEEKENLGGRKKGGGRGRKRALG